MENNKRNLNPYIAPALTPEVRMAMRGHDTKTTAEIAATPHTENATGTIATLYNGDRYNINPNRQRWERVG